MQVSWQYSVFCVCVITNRQSSSGAIVWYRLYTLMPGLAAWFSRVLQRCFPSFEFPVCDHYITDHGLVWFGWVFFGLALRPRAVRCRTVSKLFSTQGDMSPFYDILVLVFIACFSLTVWLFFRWSDVYSFLPGCCENSGHLGWVCPEGVVEWGSVEGFICLPGFAQLLFEFSHRPWLSISTDPMFRSCLLFVSHWPWPSISVDPMFRSCLLFVSHRPWPSISTDPMFRSCLLFVSQLTMTQYRLCRPYVSVLHFWVSVVCLAITDKTLP